MNNSIWRLRRPIMFYAILFVLGLDVLFAVLFYLAEDGLSLSDAFYWAVITTSTVGYGDITPKTTLGKSVAIAASIGGLISYMLLISALTELFLSIDIKRELGLLKAKNVDIVVISDDPYLAKEVIEELHARNKHKRIVLMTTEEWKTRPEDISHYIVGSPVELDDLKRAGIQNAEAIIITLRDESKALHSILLSRHINKRAKITVRALSIDSARLLEEAGADFVVQPTFVASLLAGYLTDMNSVEALCDLSDARRGAHLREIPVPEWARNKSFCEVISILKREQNMIVVGYIRGEEIRLNPDCNERMEQARALIVVDQKSLFSPREIKRFST